MAPKSDSRRIVSNMHSRARKSQRPKEDKAKLATGIAPILRLPHELIGLLCDHLTTPVIKPREHSQDEISKVVKHPDDWRALRSLCRVNKRFSEQAMPRFYRHLLHPYELERAAGQAISLKFRTLCEPAEWYLPGRNLAESVRTLQLIADRDTGILEHLVPLIDACRRASAVLLGWDGHMANIPTARAMGQLCASLQRLPKLDTLAWVVEGAKPDLSIMLGPLLSIQLSELRSLRIQYTAGKATGWPEDDWFDEKAFAGLPQLRFLDFYYIPLYSRSVSGSMEPAIAKYYGTPDNVALEIQDILTVLLERSPHFNSLAIGCPLLSQRLCSAVPEHVLARLQALCFTTYYADSDLRPLKGLANLERFNTHGRFVLQHLPPTLSTLKIQIDLYSLLPLVKYLQNELHLPVLRSLVVDIKYGLDTLDGLETEVERFVEKQKTWIRWEGLVKVARQRGIVLKPGAFANRLAEDERRKWGTE